MNQPKKFYFSLVGASAALIALSGFVPVIRAADTAVSISPSSMTYLPGDTVTYTVNVTNNGTVPLDNLTYRFSVDGNAPISGTTLEPFIQGSSGSDNFVQSGSPQSLAAGASASYQVSVTLPVDFAAKRIMAMAELNDAQDHNLDFDLQSINLAAPELVISKNAAAQANPGDSLIYTITVNNIGYAAANNVIVKDLPPAQLTFVSAPGNNCASADGVISCDAFNLDAKQSKAITLNFSIPETLACGTTLTNNAQVTADTIAVKNASASTNLPCPLPSPTPSPSSSPTPTATPAPEIIYVPVNNPGGGAGGGDAKPAPAEPKVKAARRFTPHTNAPDYIPFKQAPAIVDAIFTRTFGRKITPAESAYWKQRARADKDTVSLLTGAMSWHKNNKTQAKPAYTPANIFQIVYLRPPSKTELAYWRGRAREKRTVAALANTMLYHKLNNIKH